MPSSGAPRMSAVSEGLKILDAELQHYHAGFGQLLGKVKSMQQVISNMEKQDQDKERVKDVDESVDDIAATETPNKEQVCQSQSVAAVANSGPPTTPAPATVTTSPSTPMTGQTSSAMTGQTSGLPRSGSNATIARSQSNEANRTNSRKQSDAQGVIKSKFASVRSEAPVMGSKSRSTTRDNAKQRMGRLKMMTCWTALQQLHEETNQSGNNDETSTLNAMKQDLDISGRRSVTFGSASVKDMSMGNGALMSPVTMFKKSFMALMESDISFRPTLKAWLPHSTARIVWDFMGLFLICYDTIVIPVELAWDLAAEGVRYNILLLALTYWTADILTNFNTAFYNKGKIVLGRKKIAIHYIRTWLVPDAALVALDILLLTSTADGSLRSSRFIRIFRLVRLIKMSKTASVIDSVAVACGCAAEAMIILPLLKTLIFILVGVHMVSCGWFWMGRSSMENGEPNWLVSSGFDVINSGAQYVHAFRWVLCQFTPATNKVNPQNVPESVFAIVTIFMSMMTMGASLARISGAVQQLNAMKYAKVRRLREIRLYLLDQKVSPELSHRILTFADYSLQHSKEGIRMDFSLISVKLRQELIMHRFGDTLCLHPLLHLILKAFPDVFMRVCETITERVYETGEIVFSRGGSAQFMYIITNGDFLLQIPESSGDTQNVIVSTRHWFSDVALFSNVLHVETLKSQKFGKVCMLEGTKFASLLQGSPACAEVVIDYASRYLQSLRNDTNLTSEWLQERAQEACENTQAYQWFTGKLRLQSTDYSRADRHDDDDDEGPDFLRQVLEGSLPLQEAVSRLPIVFPELEAGETTVYSRFRGDAERYRAGASVLSALSLITNRYDLFTSPQYEENRMSADLWEELQLFVQWADLSADAIYTIVVFLIIRGVGKVKSLVDQLPLHPTESPESAVLYMMEQLSSLIPSCETVDQEGNELLVFLLEVQSEFNIGQFMQGENLAFNVARLQEYVQGRPPHYYAAYLFSFVGIMCGIAGREHWEDDIGSCFMTQKNALAIVEVLRTLQKLNNESPQSVYWGYMEARARRLDVPTPLGDGFEFQQFRLLARLLCLYRAQDLDGRRIVESALNSLDESDKRMLSNRLLEEGIDQPSYVLAFLPACLANAKANSAVGLSGCLSKLAEVYGMLDARRSLVTAGGVNVKVNLSELAKFISQVKGATVFNQCVEYVKVGGVSDSLTLSMGFKNWSRVHDDDASEFSSYQSLRQLLRGQQIMKEVLGTLVANTGSAARHRASSVHVSV